MEFWLKRWKSFPTGVKKLVLTEKVLRSSQRSDMIILPFRTGIGTDFSVKSSVKIFC